MESTLNRDRVRSMKLALDILLNSHHDLNSAADKITQAKEGEGPTR